MANWNKHIVVNAIVGKATDQTDRNSLLRRDEDFLQVVALHILALCEHEGWDPGVDESDCEGLEHIDDFTYLLDMIYDKADADLIWMGMNGDEIPQFRSNHPRVGWLGDFSKFTEEVPNGS